MIARALFPLIALAASIDAFRGEMLFACLLFSFLGDMLVIGLLALISAISFGVTLGLWLLLSRIPSEGRITTSLLSLALWNPPLGVAS